MTAGAEEHIVIPFDQPEPAAERWASAVAPYGARVARRFLFFFDDGPPCTIVHQLESTIESEAWVGFLNGEG